MTVIKFVRKDSPSVLPPNFCDSSLLLVGYDATAPLPLGSEHPSEMHAVHAASWQQVGVTTASFTRIFRSFIACFSFFLLGGYYARLRLRGSWDCVLDRSVFGAELAPPDFLFIIINV